MKKNKQKNRGRNNSKPNSPVTRNEEWIDAPMQEPMDETPYQEPSEKKHSSVNPLGICMLALTVVVAGILAWYWWETLKSSEYDAKATFSVIMPGDTLTVNIGTPVIVKSGQLITEDGTAVFSSDMMDCLTGTKVDDGPKEYAIPNKNGTKQFYQYSKKDDKKRAGFVFADDTTKKVKLAFGEMLEVGKQSKAGHEVFVLANHQIKPAFKLGKKTTFASEEGHKAIHLAKLQVYGNLLMLNVEDTGDSSKVVVYPENGNDSIISISRNAFGRDMNAQLKDASNLTFRVACNNHISSMVTADRVKIFYSPKAETTGTNTWAIVFSVLAVLQLAGLWLLFKRKKGKTVQEEDNDNPVIDDYSSSEEPSAEEKELEEINQKIENLNNEILSLRRRLSDLTAEDSKDTIQGKETKDAETNVGKNHTLEEKLLIYGPESLSDEEKTKLVKEKIMATNTYDDNEKVMKLRNDLEQFSEQSEDIILRTFDYVLPIIKEACKEGVNTEPVVSEDAKPEAELHDEPAAPSHNDTRQDLEEQLKLAESNLETLEAKKKSLEAAISQKSAAADALIQSLRQKLNELQNQNGELQAYKQKAESKISQANEEAERRVKKAEDDARKDIQEARRNEQQAREETKQIRDQVTNEFKAEIDGLNSTIGKQTTKISQLSSSLSTTSATLASTQQELESAKVTIQTKEGALERFHRTIKEVDPAKEYAEQLEKLLELGGNVEASALKLSYKKDIDDYLIPKYIARFRNAISRLEMNVFTTDVFNAAKAQFVYKTQMLATFDIGNREAFHQSMKMYFFGNYLKKYVDALVVLNETMIGTQYTVDGVTSNDVKDFVGYRAALATVLKALEVDVDYVKIMDKSDDNLALTVIPKELPDIDCPKNSICQMENCIAYLHGSDKPNEKIEVIVKN